MNVEHFLKTSANPLVDLEENYSIRIKEYPEDNLLMLNYHMIDSPKTHPITIECRSLILDLTTYSVVSRKFDRFFNLGENPEFYTDFDWDNCHIMEKADGSLIGIYYNPNTHRYEISSRSQAKCEMDHEVFGNFKLAIMDTLGFANDDMFQKYFSRVLNSKNITFIFEFISPLNRIVTPYTESSLVFLGGTYKNGNWLLKEQMEYIMDHYFKDINVRLPEFYSATKNIDDLITLANSLPNLKEGFVLWDEKSNKRVKLKSTAYLVAHRIRGENTKPTYKNILSLIFTGEADEFLAYFPEYKDLFTSANDDINTINDTLTEIWKSVKDITDQKEFALTIKNQKMSSILFMAKKDKLHPVQVFHTLDVNKKLRYFNV